MRAKVAKMIRRMVYGDMAQRPTTYRKTGGIITTPWGHKKKVEGPTISTGLRREYRLCKAIYKQRRREGLPIWQVIQNREASRA